MKTSTIEVAELISTLSAVGVERQLGTLAGVHHADVNYVSGSATVHYDESKVTLEAIRKRVSDCGYHCRGELLPSHVCNAADHPVGTGGHANHGEHRAHAAASGSPAQDKADMMHDMGHAPGMSMQDMARDMRNRFLVALIFAIPVFFYSPMGEMFGDFSAPFGLDRKLFLFIAATGAIAYPGWPFLVAAWRSARNKVANMATLVVLSVGTGYIFSVGATFFYEGEVFYEASAVLLVFILVGHRLEMRVAALSMSGSSALVALNALMLKPTRLAGIMGRKISWRGGGPCVSSCFGGVIQIMMKITAAAFLYLLALCLLGYSADALAERDVTIVRDADTIRIDAKLRVDVHHHIAWQVLTDYDNLARFVPGLSSSRIVSEPGAPMLLKQTGRSGLLWLTVPVEVVVRIEEIPLDAIRFFSVSGTLKSKSGEWRIEAQDDATLLIYRASIVPGFWVPPLIGTSVMAQDVRSKLIGVANEMTRRAASAKSGKL